MITKAERDEICSYVAQNFVSPLCFDYNDTQEAYLDLSGDKFNKFCVFMSNLINKAETENEKNPICPECGAELELDDVYDTSGHDDLCVGFCVNCGQTYQWRSMYQFIGYTDLEKA